MDVNLQSVSLVLSLPVACTALAFLVRIVRMLARLEMKIEVLWDDYSARKKDDDEFRQKMMQQRLIPREGSGG